MSTQEQVQQRINFLQKELDSLEHYLPDTYQFLMAEMDNQQRELVAIKIQDFYQEVPLPDKRSSSMRMPSLIMR
jgi:ABC-type phosphate transport system auxiliary subunit